MTFGVYNTIIKLQKYYYSNVIYMKLLQINVDEKLKNAIDKKAKSYGVPASSLVRIALMRSFMEKKKYNIKEGNVFNANRDNNGRGIHIDDFIDAL